MIAAEDFCAVLERHGYDFYTGVPCSYFQGPIEIASSRTDARYVAAANEGAALGVAAGVALAGGRPVVLLQNSGFGNLVNPLTSLCLTYGIPALVFVSLRAHPDGFRDEPQHRIMGTATMPMLEAIGLPGTPLPADAAGLDRLVGEAARRFEEGWPTVVLVPKDGIGTCAARREPTSALPLSRAEAVATVAGLVADDAVMLSTAGMISRDLFAASDLPSNFYMQGSMGHAMATGLGIALQRPERRVIVLDGDGAVLMHMGSLSTIGACSPPNLVHVVIDNEAYESTGSQPTTSAVTRLDDVARACGYRHACRCFDRSGLERAMRSALRDDGPTFVLVKVNRTVTAEPPRITSRYSPLETTGRVRRALTPTRV